MRPSRGAGACDVEPSFSIGGSDDTSPFSREEFPAPAAQQKPPKKGKAKKWATTPLGVDTEDMGAVQALIKKELQNM